MDTAPNTSVITWEDPPDYGTRGSRVPRAQAEAIGAALKERPGQWARVLTFPNAQKQAYWYVRDIRAGDIRALKGAEASARTIDGDGVVYARFPETAIEAESPDIDADVEQVALAVLRHLGKVLAAVTEPGVPE